MLKNIEIYHKIKFMYKKQNIFLILVAIIIFSGCTKDQHFLFEMGFQRDFEIKAGLNTVEEHNFVLNNFNVDTAGNLGTRGLTYNKLNGIFPSTMQLQNVSSGAAMNFIYDVSVLIVDKENPNVSLEAFYREPVPTDTGIQLDLVPTLADFKQILIKNNFDVRVKIRVRNITPEFITARLIFKLGVK